jgi:hypothetical protein
MRNLAGHLWGFGVLSTAALLGAGVEAEVAFCAISSIIIVMVRRWKEDEDQHSDLGWKNSYYG